MGIQQPPRSGWSELEAGLLSGKPEGRPPSSGRGPLPPGGCPATGWGTSPRPGHAKAPRPYLAPGGSRRPTGQRPVTRVPLRRAALSLQLQLPGRGQSTRRSSLRQARTVWVWRRFALTDHDGMYGSRCGFAEAGGPQPRRRPATVCSGAEAEPGSFPSAQETGVGPGPGGAPHLLLLARSPERVTGARLLPPRSAPRSCGGKEKGPAGFLPVGRGWVNDVAGPQGPMVCSPAFVGKGLRVRAGPLARPRIARRGPPELRRLIELFRAPRKRGPWSSPINGLADRYRNATMALGPRLAHPWAGVPTVAHQRRPHYRRAGGGYPLATRPGPGGPGPRAGGWERCGRFGLARRGRPAGVSAQAGAGDWPPGFERRRLSGGRFRQGRRARPWSCPSG